jgi:hypothetical protein
MNENSITNLHLSINRCLEKMAIADQICEATPHKGLEPVLSALKEDLEFAQANVREVLSACGNATVSVSS